MKDGLPARGALYRASQGHGWSDLEYLIAQLIDDVRRLPPAVYRAAGVTNVRNPKPIKRPGEVVKGRIGDRGGRSVEETMAWLDSLSATTRKTA